MVMDTESMNWIGIVVFAAVTFSITAFTAGMFRGEMKSQKTNQPSDSEMRAEIVALRCQVEELRFELRRSNPRTR